MQAVRALVNLLYPRTCVGCGREGAYFCPGCRPIQGGEAPPPTGLDGLITAGVYAGILGKAVREYKYEFVSDLAGTLADLMAASAGGLPASVTALVPVPLHPKRRRWRGFDQADRLATRLQPLLNRPVVPVLRRVRETATQASLKQQQRPANVRDAFAISAPPPAGVLLVDDVATTGATLSECARVLRAAGSGTVWGIVVASGD